MSISDAGHWNLNNTMNDSMPKLRTLTIDVDSWNRTRMSYLQGLSSKYKPAYQ